jgi:hypothetical protein
MMYFRSKLQSFLQQSRLYLTSPLLAKVKDTDLYKEAALLHGKVRFGSKQRANLKCFYAIKAFDYFHKLV